MTCDSAKLDNLCTTNLAKGLVEGEKSGRFPEVTFGEWHWNLTICAQTAKKKAAEYIVFQETSFWASFVESQRSTSDILSEKSWQLRCPGQNLWIFATARSARKSARRPPPSTLCFKRVILCKCLTAVPGAKFEELCYRQTRQKVRLCVRGEVVEAEKVFWP